MSGSTSQMNVVLKGSTDSDPAELESYTLALRECLLELDVEDVVLGRVGGGPPEGAKPGEVIALGALAVTVAPFAVRGVVQLLQTWIENRPVRRVSITVGEDSLDVEALSSADQRRLIDEFIGRHTSSQPEVEPAPDSGTAGQD